MPLLNPNTGNDYGCYHNKDCPMESYCDKTHLKCCSKSKIQKLFKLIKFSDIKKTYSL